MVPHRLTTTGVFLEQLSNRSLEEAVLWDYFM